METKDDVLLRLVSATAIASTIGIFFCGLPSICIRIRSRGSTDGIGSAPFLLTLLNAIFWLQYGTLKNDRVVLAVNWIGLVLSAVCTVYYYVNSRSKKRLNQLLALELVTVIAMYRYVHRRAVIETETIDNLGLACMLLNIANVASPLFAVGHVIRSKSTESLPFTLCVGSFVVTAQWLLYGILVDDFYITFPNATAVMISGCQLLLFLIYPRRNDHLSVSESSANTD